MLGVANEAAVARCLGKNFTQEGRGNFVCLTPTLATVEAAGFKLDAGKMHNLQMIAQFLEQKQD